MLSVNGYNNNSNNKQQQNDAQKFPTVGLKSLLQNSDLLDLLLKPMSDSNEVPKPNVYHPESNNTNRNIVNTTNILNSTLSDSPIMIDSNSNSPNGNLNHQMNIIEQADFDQLIDAKTKNLFDFDFNSEYLEMKANKIANGDNDSSKIYGNAFLGPNLWDKNDLFQSDIGVKFEYLEIDEFLTESGLNETDVELLDQLQKLENTNPAVINSNLNNTNVVVQTQNNTLMIQTPINNNNNSNASNLPPISSLNSNPTFPRPSPNLNEISSQQSIVQPNNQRMNSQQQSQQSNYQQYKIQKENSNANSECNSPKHHSLSGSSSSSSRSSYNDFNEQSVDSMSDFENFNPKARKFSPEELKPQPILKKSKKQIIPSEMKDDKYWNRRKKNNVAAKRSRDARRMKENHIAMRASYLERENDNLKKQLDDFKRETKQLKMRLTHYEKIHGVTPSSELNNKT